MPRKTKAKNANPPRRRKTPRRQCALKNRKVKPRIVYRKTYQHEGKAYNVTIDSKETMYVEVNGDIIYTGEYESKKIRTFHMVQNPTAKKRRALKKSNRASRVSRVMSKLGFARKYVYKVQVRINADIEDNNREAVQVIRAGNDPRLANAPVAPNVPRAGGRNIIVVGDDDDFKDSGNEDGFSDEYEDIE